MTRVALLTLASAWLALSCAPPARAAADRRPRLVVLLVVDQMRNDYIEDYGAAWTKGLRRLLDHGARFRQAAFPYLNTVTCAGHATIGTGAVPAVHGIILNQWLDREAGQAFACTDDPASPSLLYGDVKSASGHSATRLRVPTLAETIWRAQGERGRVATMSLKARSAIMLAGSRGDMVTWFEAPFWSTSRAFTEARVHAVERFVEAHPVERDRRERWTLLLPQAAYRYTDAGAGENPTAGWTREFPHPIGVLRGTPSDFYEAWQQSPFSDAYLGRMAAATVEALDLGKDEVTDVLGVSFSALDHVGHDYGPRSYEVQDLLARLDVTIGRLLDHLDKRVGRDRYVVALSSDHGVATLPEQLNGPGDDAGRVIMTTVVGRVRAVLAPALGEGRHVARMDYTSLYFEPGVFDRIRGTPGLYESVVQAIRETPGVLAVFDARTLDGRNPPADPIARAAALSTFPGRSGDLIVVPKLNWFFVADDKAAAAGGTTHGTSYPYDARVPVVLMGAGVRPGVYDGAATPADIAPSLAALCGIAMPSATGRVLREALALPPAADTQAH